ncbi:hypothetical protein NE237_013473 [Protea cynaroides]|uniref:Uncharacterized protein n=1 Tax=Protea cynaroides TaxID=273540 RepID=A0A9Q0JZU2_9MAGN|nr:hypothetical protein NE237_013473 [Protea cynaroides]
MEFHPHLAKTNLSSGIPPTSSKKLSGGNQVAKNLSLQDDSGLIQCGNRSWLPTIFFFSLDLNQISLKFKDSKNFSLPLLELAQGLHSYPQQLRGKKKKVEPPPLSSSMYFSSKKNNKRWNISWVPTSYPKG